MTANVANQVTYLRTTRNFPREINQLSIEIDRSYIDIANSVNQRTIGIFPTNLPAVTGESWFFTSARQQSLRQIYPITSYTAFKHNLNFPSISTFTKITGIGYDGTNYFPLPYVSGVDATDQVGLYVTSSEVVFSNGAGAPVIESGFILLEWLSFP